MSRRRGVLSCLCLAVSAALTLAQQPAPPALPAINPANARLDQTIGGLDGPGFAITASPLGDVLVAACEEKSVQYWKRDVVMGVRAGERTANVLNGHEGPVLAVAWLGESTLVTAGADRKLFLWQMPEGKQLQTHSAAAVVRALAASSDGKTLATAEDNVVQLRDATGKPGLKLAGHGDWVLALAFSPDGSRLASGSADGKLIVWEVPSGKKLIDVSGEPPPPAGSTGLPDQVTSLAYSADGKLLALGASDSRVHLFNPADGKIVRTIAGHTSAVTALAFHPGNGVLVSGSKDRTVRLWNPANGQPFKVLEGHTAWVQGLVILEKGTRVASVGADRTVRLWDLREPPK